MLLMTRRQTNPRGIIAAHRRTAGNESSKVVAESNSATTELEMKHRREIHGNPRDSVKADQIEKWFGKHEKLDCLQNCLQRCRRKNRNEVYVIENIGRGDRI